MKNRIIIDGEVLAAKHNSGIGHYTFELIKELDNIAEENSNIQLYIFVYFKNINKIKSYNFKKIKILPLLFSPRIINYLKKINLLPPINLFFGKAVYIFPNFSSWQLFNTSSKSVTFVYDISFERLPQFAEPKNQKYLSREVKKCVINSNITATISEFCKKEITDFYNIPKNNVKIYYPAVNQELFYKRSEKEVDLIKQKYGVNKKYILFVGNIEPRKNLKNLLLAYEILPLEIKNDYSLLLVGAKGWQDNEIFQIVSRLKANGADIIFPTKYVSDQDLPAIYSGASVFIYPSIYEGFGIPPLEAMSCGTPVVCADNSSLPEAVGDAAIMVDAANIEDISKSINRLLDSQKARNNQIKKGYEQIDKFSWSASAQKLINDINKL